MPGHGSGSSGSSSKKTKESESRHYSTKKSSREGSHHSSRKSTPSVSNSSKNKTTSSVGGHRHVSETYSASGGSSKSSKEETTHGDSGYPGQNQPEPTGGSYADAGYSTHGGSNLAIQSHVTSAGRAEPARANTVPGGSTQSGSYATGGLASKRNSPSGSAATPGGSGQPDTGYVSIFGDGLPRTSQQHATPAVSAPPITDNTVSSRRATPPGSTGQPTTDYTISGRSGLHGAGNSTFSVGFNTFPAPTGVRQLFERTFPGQNFDHPPAPRETPQLWHCWCGQGLITDMQTMECAKCEKCRGPRDSYYSADDAVVQTVGTYQDAKDDCEVAIQEGKIRYRGVEPARDETKLYSLAATATRSPRIPVDPSTQGEQESEQTRRQKDVEFWGKQQTSKEQATQHERERHERNAPSSYAQVPPAATPDNLADLRTFPLQNRPNSTGEFPVSNLRAGSYTGDLQESPMWATQNSQYANPNAYTKVGNPNDPNQREHFRRIHDPLISEPADSERTNSCEPFPPAFKREGAEHHPYWD